MLSYIIRPMISSDIPRCIAIAAECWGRLTAQMAQPDFESMFSSAVWKPFFYVAEVNGTVAGVAGYGTSWLTNGVYHMFWHGIAIDARRQGIGSALVNRRLLDLAPVADVVMIVTNIPDYYKRFKFEIITQIDTAGDYGKYVMIRRREK